MVHVHQDVKKQKSKLKPQGIGEEPEISEEYKKKLEEIREEVKKGKYTRYKDVKELVKDLGL